MALLANIIYYVDNSYDRYLSSSQECIIYNKR